MGSPGAARRTIPGRVGAWLVLVLAVVMGGLVVPTAAHASTTGTNLSGDNSFLAYVAAGESLRVTTSGASSVSVTDPGGTVTGRLPSPWTSAPSATAGVWTVAITGSAVTWDVSVLRAGAEVAGRVWTPSLSLSEGSTPTKRTLWLVNDAGFEYRLDLDSFVGMGWTMVANAVGLSGPDAGCAPTYASSDAGIDRTAIVQCGGYRIFFEAPADDLPATSVAAGRPVTVRPPTLTAADLSGVRISATPAATGAVLSWTLPAGFSGGYELLLDLDGTGGPSARNRTIQLGAVSGGKVQYTWDGRDGSGALVDGCSSPTARLQFSRLGEIHVPQYDVEGRAVTLTRLTGVGAPDSTMYWDDTRLTGSRVNTTPILDATSGRDSRTDRHGWAYASNSWGNNRTIDDWAYQKVDVTTPSVAIGSSCQVAGWPDQDVTTPLTAGQSSSFDLDITNRGLVAQPVDRLVDLSGVADDADVNLSGFDLPDWLSATVSGHTVRFTGTAPAGASVRIALPFTVHATRTGDDRLTVTLSGQGSAASSLTRLVTRTAVTWATDPIPGSVVTPGSTVTYTVRVASTGSAPAQVDLLDDLTGVLDDAAWVSSVSSDPGITASMTGGRVQIGGTLAAGRSATVTTTVTVGETRGDNVLTRAVLAGGEQTTPLSGVVENPVVDVDTTVTITGARQPVRAGDLITITLRATNTGAVVALADERIDLSGVLDDAVLTGPPASTLALTYAGGVLTATGPVEVGQTATLTLTARVLGDQARGDSVLAAAPDGCTPQDCPPVPVADGGQVFDLTPAWTGLTPPVMESTGTVIGSAVPGSPSSVAPPATAGAIPAADANRAAGANRDAGANADAGANGDDASTLPSTGGEDRGVVVLGGWLTAGGVVLLATRAGRRHV